MDDRGYAALLLGQWARNHGIYEIRDVLAAAVTLAEQATSGEELGIALEQVVVVKQAPQAQKAEQAPDPLPEQKEELPARSSSKTRASRKADG